jgi:hypothetical protein
VIVPRSSFGCSGTFAPRLIFHHTTS